MPRFSLLFTLCLFLCSSCMDVDSGGDTTIQQQSTPNIIFILTDDQGYGDLARHGHPCSAPRTRTAFTMKACALTTSTSAPPAPPLVRL